LAGDEVAACAVDSGGGKFDRVDRKTKPTPGAADDERKR
jgi:hypothetical protein